MKLRTLAAAVATIALSACQTMAGGGDVASGLSTVVKLDSGYVAGINGPVRTYKGIPYAAPPVGPLRWKAAQPVKAWDGVREAKTFGPDCLQRAAGGSNASEDCLTLS